MVTMYPKFCEFRISLLVALMSNAPDSLVSIRLFVDLLAFSFDIDRLGRNGEL